MGLKRWFWLLAARLGIVLPPCGHSWRPALWRGRPARFCRICETPEELTEDQFYAHFGEMAAAMRSRMAIALSPWHK